jgi:Ca2+-binding EF-hand superfamily protein
MSISSISSASSSLIPTSRQRPDSGKLASQLFAQLDSKGQGYINKSDLQNAVSGASPASSSTGSVDELFTQLDSNGDGKVTKSEFADLLQKLAESLDSQAMSSRLQQTGSAAADAGLTKDQLTSIASDLSASDSKRASLMSDIAANFDKADADHDGKVTIKEAMAYADSKKTASTSQVLTTDNASASDAQTRILQQLLQLAQAYDSRSNTPGTGLSVSV